MSDLKHYIERQMNDPEFKAEYDVSETEYPVNPFFDCRKNSVQHDTKRTRRQKWCSSVQYKPH